jgi:hypothetical protein
MGCISSKNKNKNKNVFVDKLLKVTVLNRLVKKSEKMGRYETSHQTAIEKCQDNLMKFLQFSPEFVYRHLGTERYDIKSFYEILKTNYAFSYDMHMSVSNLMYKEFKAIQIDINRLTILEMQEYMGSEKKVKLSNSEKTITKK